MPHRLFFAIEVGSCVETALRRLIEALKTSSADVRWISEGPLHLTLVFLGRVEGEKIPLAVEAASRCAAQHLPFSTTISQIGVFPSWAQPRVLWVGSTAAKPLCSLAESLRKELAAVGFSIEPQPFVPHITLGRIRSRRALKNLKTVTQKQDCAAEFSTSEIILFESYLGARGAWHEVLSRIPLGRQEIQVTASHLCS